MIKFNKIFDLYFSIAIISLLSLNSYAQEINLDSLYDVSKNEKNISIKIKKLQELAELARIYSNWGLKEKALIDILNNYKNLGIKEEEFKSLLSLQYLYEETKQIDKYTLTKLQISELLFDLKLYTKAKDYLLETEKYFHLIDNIALKQKVYSLLGDIYSIDGDSNTAISWYTKALSQSKKLSDKSKIYYLYQSIGEQFLISGQYESGIKYYNSILSQMDFNSSKNMKGIMYNNLGVLNSKEENLNKAIDNFNLAIKLLPEGENFNNLLAQTHYNLGIILFKQNNTERAIRELEKSIELSNINGSSLQSAEAKLAISNIYYLSSDYYNALLYVDIALEDARKSQNREFIVNAILFKSKIYQALNNYELERDLKSEYYQEDSFIKQEKEQLENKVIADRINFESIEKEFLVKQKSRAEETANKERIKAEEEARNARELKILKDKAIIETQNEIAKNKLIEAEKNTALAKARQDSLSAANAKVQEESALQKARTDSISAVLALQKQKVAQKEVEDAKKIVNRTRLIGILLGLLVLFATVVGFYLGSLNNKIRNEKKKADDLLLNILPELVADELKANNFVEPRKYDKVSVLFTDFVDFTSTAAKMSSDELISELDNYFNEFDKIIEKHGLEKIKTIGDAYMCAGGVPVENQNNPIDTVKAAIEIAEFVEKQRSLRESQNRISWEIRIGIHTGSVIAGVVGSKKFAYDIWGDTVNTASRIESNGLIGKVNISESTYLEVKDHFKCESRGEIEVKNIGKVKMYYVS